VLGNAVLYVGNLWGTRRRPDLWDFCGARTRRYPGGQAGFFGPALDVKPEPVPLVEVLFSGSQRPFSGMGWCMRRPAGTSHDRWPGLRLQHADLVCGEARESRASLGPLAARAGDRGHFDGEHGPGLVTRSCRSCGRGLACVRSVSWVRMSSWSGSSALLGRWNMKSQVSTQPRPTAGTTAGANLAQLPSKEGGRASRPAMTTPSGGKIPEIT
jgi:hypothetical protein